MMTHRQFTTTFLTALVLLIPTLVQSEISIVPKPQELRLIADKPFTLDPKTRINWSGEGCQKVAELLALGLRPATGFELSVAESQQRGSNSILLTIQPK